MSSAPPRPTALSGLLSVGRDLDFGGGLDECQQFLIQTRSELFAFVIAAPRITHGFRPIFPSLAAVLRMLRNSP